MDPQRHLGPSEQRESARTLNAGLDMVGMSVDQLSEDALALNGAWTRSDVRSMLDGARTCTAHEHDVLAQAINDSFVEQGDDHPVRYSDELDHRDRASGSSIEA